MSFLRGKITKQPITLESSKIGYIYVGTLSIFSAVQSKSWMTILVFLVYGFSMVVIPMILKSDSKVMPQEYNEYRLSIFPLLQEQDSLIMKWDKSNDKQSIGFVNDFQAIEDKMKAIQPEDERLRSMHAPLIVRSQALTPALEKLHKAEDPENPEFLQRGRSTFNKGQTPA